MLAPCGARTTGGEWETVEFMVGGGKEIVYASGPQFADAAPAMAPVRTNSSAHSISG